LAVVATAVVSRPAAMLVGWIAHLGAAGLVGSSELVRYAPALAYRVAPPSWTVVALYYTAAAAAWVLWQIGTRVGSAAPGWMRFGRHASATLSIGAALWILIDPRSLVAARGDGRLHVTFIDVGQGDAAFVRFPCGSTLVVDAGGLSAASGFDIGDRVVAPVVRDAGFHHVDYLTLTHGDPDHIGGATAILNEFRPREVWEGIPVPRFEPLTRLRMVAQAHGAKWANVYVGDHLSIDEVEVVVRHPSVADWARQKVRNDDSVVLELGWRDVSVLLTGDIGRAVERAISPRIPPSRLRVVKVPHHGSLSSSSPEFLGEVRPQVAVVSAGRANHFGHPAAEVLERYRAVGAEIFRTDRDGAVTVDTDGTSLVVHTFTGRQLTLK
jgi:competence protein ComEC